MANSPLLQIPQVAPSQTNKETTINDGFSILERSLNDAAEIDLTTANVVLTMTDYTRAGMFKLNAGTATGRTLSLPASRRIFMVMNIGDHDITVDVNGESGLTAIIHSNSLCVIFNDGVNVYLISDSAASGQVSAFLSLPDTPDSFAGEAGRAIVVNATEDGLDFGTITVRFTDLTDGPSSYSGQANKVVKVKASADGIEFGTYYQNLIDLLDTPAAYTDNAGRLLVVKSSEDGMEFADFPDGVIVQTRAFILPNAGFEDNAFTNWLLPSTSGSIWTVGSSFGALVPSEGSYFAYFDTGQGTEPAAIAYTVDLTDQAYADELDDGPQLQVVVSMGSVTSDLGSIQVEYQSESGATISTTTSPTYLSSTTFTDRTFKSDVPVGARTAVIYLNAEHNAAGDDPDNMTFAFDNLRVSLKLNVEQINFFTQLQDTPSTFTGEAGKALVVNPGETGLTFADIPSVKNNFTDLNDTPADYAGASKKYVRVNTGTGGNGTALEFIQPTFLELSDVPAAYAGKAKKTVRVNTAEDGLEFVTPVLADLSDLVIATPTDGQVLTYDETSGKWVNADAGAASVDTAMSVVTKTASYTFVLTDMYNKYFRANSASALSFTVPANASVAAAIGSVITGIQAGAGQLTFVADTGVTINTPETLSLRKQFSSFNLVKVGTDEWDLTGDLELA